MNTAHQSPITRVGVLGGTFDPPHNGHLLIAQQALTQLKLDQVLFAPTRQPPHKDVHAITPVEHRVEMVRLAIAGYPGFALSRVDVDRQGPTFTLDTMRLLRGQLGKSAELYFIMGMDSLANILTWRDPAKLIQICNLAVFARPGFQADLRDLEKAIPNLAASIVFLPTTAVKIAASDLQRRISAGLPITELIPTPVVKYIHEHKLYQNS